MAAADIVYRDLGPFGGLVAAAEDVRPLAPAPGHSVRAAAADLFRFGIGHEAPEDLRVEERWSADGVDGEVLSWSAGYGPRTEAFLLRPAGLAGRLPGVVALFDHGHFKFLGKEKIADGPEGPDPRVAGFRRTYYGGRGFANALARRGYAVLVHDVFLWGSRRFPLEAMPERERLLAEAVGATLGHDGAGEEAVRYNGAAYLHEHVMARYCALLGTSITAVVAHEDRVALACLAGREDVDPARIAAVGFSGGGLRAALMSATGTGIAASVVTGMMSTYRALLDAGVAPHTWMLFPPGWSMVADWPDLAASAAPMPLLVQYLLDDALFPAEGMRAADRRIAAAYAAAGAASAHAGQFFPGPHRFDVEVQEAAFAWLDGQLAPG